MKTQNRRFIPTPPHWVNDSVKKSGTAMSRVKQPPDPDIPALEGEEQVDPHQAETPIEDTNPDHDDEHQPERDNIGNNV